MPSQEELRKRVSYSAILWLRGEDLDPEAISDCLGVEPCSSWKRGDPCRGPKATVCDNGGWEISVKGEWGESLESVLVELFSWFEGVEPDLALLSAQYNGYISIGEYYQTRYICYPTWYLPLESLKKIANLNLAISASAYPCSSPGEEGESGDKCNVNCGS